MELTDTSKALIRFVQERPASSLGDIKRVSNIKPESSISGLLSRLIKNKLLVRTGTYRQFRYYLPNAAPRDETLTSAGKIHHRRKNKTKKSTEEERKVLILINVGVNKTSEPLSLDEARDVYKQLKQLFKDT